MLRFWRGQTDSGEWFCFCVPSLRYAFLTVLTLAVVQVVDQIDTLTCDLQLEDEMTDSSKTDTLNSSSSSTTASSLEKVGAGQRAPHQAACAPLRDPHRAAEAKPAPSSASTDACQMR